NLICKQSTPWNCSGRERSAERRDRAEEIRDNDENGKKDPVLKNANEAEVKESCTRPKSQADLIVVFVRLTVSFVCSRLTYLCPSILQRPSEQFPRVHPRPLRLNPGTRTRPLTKFFFISVALWLDARYDFTTSR
ncbi:hypothetical protein ALC56_05203, partial [Trachymyrmex septentrionalis]